VSARHLVLVGLMGAGKTTVGGRCAARLGRAFVDTDDVVVASAGMPVDEIFRSEGEARFRERERAAVADLFQRVQGVLGRMFRDPGRC